MKIHAIFTGGTIGSKVNDKGVISPAKSATFSLLERYRKEHGQSVRFLCQEPYYILSENLDFEHVAMLIECVGTCLTQQADGILVMHGTDSLQYSAAFLQYLFADARIPIVLVSSNYPLEDERANGYTNFCRAVDFIRAKAGTGVFVSYENPGSIPRIHRASRLLAHQAYSDRLESLSGQIYGSFFRGQFQKNPYYEDGTKDTLFGRKALTLLSGLKTLKRDAVLRLYAHVGMNYPAISEETRAILIESYHSGTIELCEEGKSFFAEAKDKGIPVYLVGLSGGEKVYETVEAYQKLGIHILPQCTPISQYVKLSLAIAGGFSLEEVMQTPMGEDFVAHPLHS